MVSIAVVQTNNSNSSASASSSSSSLNNSSTKIMNKFSKSLSDLILSINPQQQQQQKISKEVSSIESSTFSATSEHSNVQKSYSVDHDEEENNEECDDYNHRRNNHRTKSMSMSSLGLSLFTSGCFPVSRGSPDGSSSEDHVVDETSEQDEMDQKQNTKTIECTNQNQNHSRSTVGSLYKIRRYLSSNHRPKRATSESNLINELANNLEKSKDGLVPSSSTIVSNATSVPNIAILQSFEKNPDPSNDITIEQSKQYNQEDNIKSNHSIIQGTGSKYRKNEMSTKRYSNNRYISAHSNNPNANNININCNTLPNNLLNVQHTTTALHIPTADSSLSLGLLGSTISFTPSMSHLSSSSSSSNSNMMPNSTSHNNDYRYLTYGTSAQLQQEYGKFLPWPTLTEFRLRRKLKRFKRRARKLFNGNNLFGKSFERIQNVRRLIKMAKLAKQDPEQMLNEMMMMGGNQKQFTNQSEQEILSRSSSLTSLLDLIEEANKNLLNGFQEEDDMRGLSCPPPPPRLKRAMSSINFSSVTNSFDSRPLNYEKEGFNRQRYEPMRNKQNRWSTMSAVTSKTNTVDNYRIAFVESKQPVNAEHNSMIDTNNANSDIISVKNLDSYLDKTTTEDNGVDIPSVLQDKNDKEDVVVDKTTLNEISKPQQLKEELEKNSKILCVRSHFQINDGTIYLEDSDWEMCSEISEPLSLNDPTLINADDDDCKGANDDKPSLVDLALSQSILNPIIMNGVESSDGGFGSDSSGLNTNPIENNLEQCVALNSDLNLMQNNEEQNISIALSDIPEESLTQLENEQPQAALVIESESKEDNLITTIVNTTKAETTEHVELKQDPTPKTINTNKNNRKRIKARAPPPPPPPIAAQKKTPVVTTENESSKHTLKMVMTNKNKVETEAKAMIVQSMEDTATLKPKIDDQNTTQTPMQSPKPLIIVEENHSSKQSKQQQQQSTMANKKQRGFKLLSKFHRNNPANKKKQKQQQKQQILDNSKMSKNTDSEDFNNNIDMDTNSVKFLIEKFNQNESIQKMFQSQQTIKNKIQKQQATNDIPTTDNDNIKKVDKTNFERMCSLFSMMNLDNKNQKLSTTTMTVDNVHKRIDDNSSSWYFFIENMIRRIVIEQQQQQASMFETTGSSQAQQQHQQQQMIDGNGNDNRPQDNLLLLLLMLQYQQQQNQQKQLNELKLLQVLQQQQQEMKKIQNQNSDDETEFTRILIQVQKLLEQCKNNNYNNKLDDKTSKSEQSETDFNNNIIDDQSKTNETLVIENIIQPVSEEIKKSENLEKKLNAPEETSTINSNIETDCDVQCNNTINRFVNTIVINNQLDEDKDNNQTKSKIENETPDSLQKVNDNLDNKVKVQIKTKEEMKTKPNENENKRLEDQTLKHKTVLQLKSNCNRSKFRIIHSLWYHLEKKRNKSIVEKMKREQNEQDKRLDSLLRLSTVSLATIMEESGNGSKKLETEPSTLVTLANTSTIEIKQQENLIKKQITLDDNNVHKKQGTLRRLFSSLPRDGTADTDFEKQPHLNRSKKAKKEQKGTNRRHSMLMMNISEPYPLGVESSVLLTTAAMSRSTMNLNNNYDQDDAQDYYHNNERIDQFNNYYSHYNSSPSTIKSPKSKQTRCMSEKNFRPIIKLNESLNHAFEQVDTEDIDQNHQDQDQETVDSLDFYDSVSYKQNYRHRLVRKMKNPNRKFSSRIRPTDFVENSETEKEEDKRLEEIPSFRFDKHFGHHWIYSNNNNENNNNTSSAISSSTSSLQSSNISSSNDGFYGVGSKIASNSFRRKITTATDDTLGVSRTRLLNGRSRLLLNNNNNQKKSIGSQSFHDNNNRPLVATSKLLTMSQKEQQRQPVVTFTLPRNFKTRSNPIYINSNSINNNRINLNNPKKYKILQRKIQKVEDYSNDYEDFEYQEQESTTDQEESRENGTEVESETVEEEELETTEEESPYYLKHLAPKSKLNQRYFNRNNINRIYRRRSMIDNNNYINDNGTCQFVRR